jgi:hypothetical protein
VRVWELERVSLSRVEESRGWLGRTQADPSEAGAFASWRDEPSDREDEPRAAA